MSGYTLRTIGDRLVIVNQDGGETFGFEADDADFAQEVLRRLNSSEVDND